MRQDLAEHARGTIAIWGDTRIATSLSFLYRREREDDPPIRALRDVVGAVWKTPENVVRSALHGTITRASASNGSNEPNRST